MVLTNLTNLTTTTGFEGVVRFANDQTGGLVALMFTIFIFVVILLMSLRRYKIVEGLLISSFFAFAISITLVILEYLNFYVLICYVVIMIVSGYATYVTRDRF